MDWDFVIKIAVWTVGVTSMMNGLFSVENKKLKIVVTAVVGAIGGILLMLLPEKVFLTVIGISVAVVFYDSILKMIGRVLKGSEQ